MKPIVSFILCFIACQYVWAAKGSNTTAALKYPLLVKKFYDRNRNKLSWCTSEEMQKGIISLITNAKYLGLNKDNYHSVSLSPYEQDSSKLYRADRLITDALISYCKDIYQGKNINAHIRYDELSPACANKDNDYILTKLSLVRSIEELQQFVASLEPATPAYLSLKNEFRSQLDSNHSVKVARLRNSLNLYRWVYHFHFDKYIVVNIGSASLRYYSGGNEQLYSKLVVGKPSTKTPRFAAYCNEIILYPHWNVPKSIATKELLPRIKRSPHVIDAMNMQLIDNNGHVVNHYNINWSRYSRNYFPFQLRQSTGCDNSLGVIKFNLTDPFSVYLHDTNAKRLFESKRRYYSHGCIRVEKALDLADNILPNKLDPQFLKACIEGQKPIPVALTSPVPVFVIYSLVETDADNITYYPDTYHLL